MLYRYRLLLVGCVALVASVVLHATRPPTTEARLRRDWFWAMKTHQTEEVDFIVYGDSRVGQAIDTRPFQEALPGMTPRNMGYPGAGFNPEMYDHLRRMSEGKDGMIVLLGITPYGLSTEANANKKFLEEWNRPRSEVRERLQWYPLLGAFEPLAPSQYRNAKSGKGMFITYHPDGWEEAYEEPADARKWIPGYQGHFRRTQCDPANIEATLDFVRWCVERGIEVYGFRPPTTPEMEGLEDENSGFVEAEFVEAFEAAGAIWLETKDRFAYYSYDGCHLHYKAARSFSKHLAARLVAARASD